MLYQKHFAQPLGTNHNNTSRSIIQLQRFLDKDAILLDVRTIQEFDRRHLPNARHIDYDQLSNLLTHVKGWEVPIISYSCYGGRSRLATQILRNANIETIDGGAKDTLEVLIKLIAKASL